MELLLFGEEISEAQRNKAEIVQLVNVIAGF